MTPVFFEACLMTGFKGKTLVSKCPTFQGLFRLTDAAMYVAASDGRENGALKNNEV